MFVILITQELSSNKVFLSISGHGINPVDLATIRKEIIMRVTLIQKKQQGLVKEVSVWMEMILLIHVNQKQHKIQMSSQEYYTAPTLHMLHRSGNGVLELLSL